MTQATGLFVQKSITVQAPVERAFAVFTERFDAWWPRTHHIGESDMATAILEQRQGGRWYEKGVDGSECDWGTVLAWEPPRRVVLSWQINGDWKYEPDLAKSSELEVRFIPDGPERTRVELQHRALERHGPGAEQMRRDVGSDEGGWGGLLKLYAAAVEG
jgi:uncharacterized protein YndB with AHSA1/START domain